MKRVRGGDIGEIVAGQCYWNMGALWVERAAQNWAEPDRQELVGHGVADPQLALHGLGLGRPHRRAARPQPRRHELGLRRPPRQVHRHGRPRGAHRPQFGNIYDHFAVEYEYPNGARVLSMCRQTAGAAENVSERVVGTTGFSYTDSADGYIKGAKPYESEQASPNPYVQEHADLIASIKAGKPLTRDGRSRRAA